MATQGYAAARWGWYQGSDFTVVVGPSSTSTPPPPPSASVGVRTLDVVQERPPATAFHIATPFDPDVELEVALAVSKADHQAEALAATAPPLTAAEESDELNRALLLSRAEFVNEMLERRPRWEKELFIWDNHVARAEELNAMEEEAKRDWEMRCMEAANMHM